MLLEEERGGGKTRHRFLFIRQGGRKNVFGWRREDEGEMEEGKEGRGRECFLKEEKIGREIFYYIFLRSKGRYLAIE